MIEATLTLIGFVTGLYLHNLKRTTRKGRTVYSPCGDVFIKYTYKEELFYMCKSDMSKKDWLLLCNKTIQYMGQTEIFN